MVSLNSPKTIWQLPNIATAPVTLSRNDIMLLAHDVPPGGSGFYYHLSFGELFNSFTATNSLFGAVKIFNNSLSSSSIVYNKDQVDDKLTAKENTIVTLSTAKGGTGLNTYAKYDLIYASEINTLSNFATAINSVLTTDSEGAPIWTSISSILSQVSIPPATPTTIGGVKTNAFSADPIVYLASEVDLLLPSDTNPLAVDSGGTGIGDLTGLVNKFITVNEDENGYQFSAISSSDDTVIVEQDVNGNIDLTLPQAIEIDSLMQFAKVTIRTPNEGGGASNHSVLDIRSNSGGVTLPRISTSTYSTWSNPTTGSILYDSSTNKVVYHNGTIWKNLGEGEVALMPEMYLNDLLDASTIGAATNSYLKKSSTDWIAGDFSTDVNSLITTARSTYSISNLTGVFTGAGTQGQIATYSNNGKITFVDASTFVSTEFILNDLTDVTVNGAATGSYLKKSNGDWIAGNFSTDVNSLITTARSTYTISNLTGVFTSAGTLGQVATYDSNGRITFVNASTLTTAVSNLDALTDVTVASAATNSYLKKSAGDWIAGDFSTDVNSLITTARSTYTISNLTGVFAGTGTLGQIPTLDSNGKLTFSNASTFNISLDNLSDVVLSGTINNNFYLRHDGTNWVNRNFFTDVDGRITASRNNSTIANYTGLFNSIGTTGQIASYNANGKITFIDNNLDGLTDVTVSGAATNSYLKKSSTDWIAGDFSTDVNSLITTARSTYTISNLTGVFNSGGTTGQIASLNANGRITFINNSSGASNLDSLTDVVISSPVLSQVIYFDGSNWVNFDITNLIDTRFGQRISTINISNATGIFNGTGTVGQVATYDSNGKITFTTPNNTTFDSLSDTTFNSLIVNDYPSFNGSAWVNRGFNSDWANLFNLNIPNLDVATLTGLFDTTGTTDYLVAKSSTGKLKFVPATGATYAFNDLTGVTLTSLADTSYLRYNGTVWVNNNFNTDVDARMIASASTFTVSNLTGVFNSTGTTGQLATRGSNGRITWVDDTGATFPSLDEVTDVTVSGAATNSYLKKSSTDWIAGDFSTDVNSLITTARSTYTIGNLTGVFTSTGTLGQVPVIDASGKLTFISSPALTSIALDDLSDVTIASPSSGNILHYSAGNWVNTAYNTLFDSRWSTVRSSVTMAQLSSIFTGSGTTGQTLQLNSSGLLQFVNSSNSFNGLSDVTLTSLANLDYARYNGTAWVNRNFNTDVDARADAKLTAATISTLSGVFAGTGTTNQIATLNSGGKIVFTAPPPGTNSSNPVLIDAGGTGLTSYTGMAGKFLTVSPAENSFNLSTITSTDNSISITQASSGNFNLSVNAANAVPKQLFKTVTSSYSLVEADHGYMIKCSGGITITLSSGLSNGFQVTLFNETGGTITIASAGTIKSKKRTFSIQYGAINAIHESSNVWYAVGDFDT